MGDVEHPDILDTALEDELNSPDRRSATSRGAGKTYTAAVLVEEMMAAGLADLPLAQTAGALLADKVVDDRVLAVLDRPRCPSPPRAAHDRLR